MAGTETETETEWTAARLTFGMDCQIKSWDGFLSEGARQGGSEKHLGSSCSQATTGANARGSENTNSP